MKSKIESFYEKHDCSRICQGDILRDIEFYSLVEEKKFNFRYIIILSQDCDLKWSKEIVEGNDKDSCSDKFLPNILLLPAFPLAEVQEGIHLKELFGIEQKGFGEKEIKKIKKNNSELRFHYLPFFQDYQCQETIIDFKIYYTLPFEYLEKIHKEKYIATINELFREYLSQRFSNYLSRIGLPEINKEYNKE